MSCGSRLVNERARNSGTTVKITRFSRADTDEIMMLFRHTVHRVNKADYSPAQLAAWAPTRLNRAIWARRLSRNHTVVAQTRTGLAGFAELTPDFAVHTLFVGPAHQRRGVATALLGALEAQAKQCGAQVLTTHASLTARAFFQAQGFKLLRRQVVVLRGRGLVNFAMVKHLGR